MLSQAQIDFIASVIGVTAEELATGIASETEAEFTLPTGSFLSTEQRATLEDNLSKSGYDRGATAGREMILKDMAKEAGLEGTYKGTDFLNAYKDHILKDVSTEPDERLSALQETVTALQGKIAEKDQFIVDLENKSKTEARNREIMGLIPDISERTGLNSQEALQLFLNTHEITEDGIKRNGEMLYDDLRNPLGLKDSVSSWIESKGWNKPEIDGRGKGKPGAKGGTPKTIDDFKAALADKGWNEGSVEANELFRQMAAENPEILED